jgi:hypothetical protein
MMCQRLSAWLQSSFDDVACAGGPASITIPETRNFKFCRSQEGKNHGLCSFFTTRAMSDKVGHLHFFACPGFFEAFVQANSRLTRLITYCVSSNFWSAADSMNLQSVTVRTRKFITNRLLERKQFVSSSFLKNIKEMWTEIIIFI